MMAPNIKSCSLYTQVYYCWHLGTRSLHVVCVFLVQILEPVIKEEPGLTREMVKHLGLIEETVLEQLAWRSGSPLFDTIDAAGGRVPHYEDVSAFLFHLYVIIKMTGTALGMLSLLVYPPTPGNRGTHTRCSIRYAGRSACN